MQLPQEGLIGLEMKLFFKKKKREKLAMYPLFTCLIALSPLLWLFSCCLCRSSVPDRLRGPLVMVKKQFKDPIYSSIQFKAKKSVAKNKQEI